MRKSCGIGWVYKASLASLHEIGLRPSMPGTQSVIAPLGAKRVRKTVRNQQSQTHQLPCDTS